MNDLAKLVIHRMEGTETVWHRCFANGESFRVREDIFGSSQWIEEVTEGYIGAVNFLSVILFKMDHFWTYEDRERFITDWANVLKANANGHVIFPLDCLTKLDYSGSLDEFDWCLSLEDADKLLLQTRMNWKLEEVLEHLLTESRNDGQTLYDESGAVYSKTWKAGYGPLPQMVQSGISQSAASPEPSMLLGELSDDSKWPVELGYALAAWKAVSAAIQPGQKPGAELDEWLKKTYPDLTDSMRGHIKTVANWDRTSGRGKKQ